MSQENIRAWEINGLSLALDLADADVMERYEKAFDIMDDEEKALPKDGRGSAFIRAYCQMYRNLYDNVFGAGTSDLIFKDVPTNSEKYDEIYDDFLNAVGEIRMSIVQRQAKIIEKYIPANRKQRRAANKKKK